MVTTTTNTPTTDAPSTLRIEATSCDTGGEALGVTPWLGSGLGSGLGLGLGLGCIVPHGGRALPLTSIPTLTSTPTPNHLPLPLSLPLTSTPTPNLLLMV